MKRAALFAFSLMLSRSFAAEDYGRLIFQDDFARSESQELKDEPGNGWATNSQSRAKGHKQVDLREGALFISTHAEANHAHPSRIRSNLPMACSRCASCCRTRGIPSA
jgi:hypothetical protein